jgi:hypothetical protein
MTSPTSLAPLALLTVLAGACVYTPESGTYFDPGRDQTFAGFASNPGATIRLFALELDTNEWIELATATASDSPYTLRHDRTHYLWSLHATLEDQPDWECFLHPSCTIPSEGVYEVRFQIREDDGAAPILYTFDEGGLACWNQRYQSGQDAYVAYWPCRAEIFDELRLRVAIIW